MQNIFFLAIIGIVFYGVVIYLIVLVIKALRKYLKSTDVDYKKTLIIWRINSTFGTDELDGCVMFGIG